MFAESPRLPAVKRFLSKPPKNAHKMRCAVVPLGSSNEIVLQEWANDDELVPALAIEILQLLEENAAELNAALTCTLSYWSATEQQVGPTKVLQIRNPNSRASQSLDSTAEQLSGDYTSQAVQAQKHHEVMAKMYLMHLDGLLQSSRATLEHTMELCERLAAKVVESEQVAAKAVAEKREMEEVMDRVSESQGEDSQVSVAQSQVMQQIAPFLPQIIAAVIRGQLPPAAGASAPPAAE
jgi:hypothetical protein